MGTTEIYSAMLKNQRGKISATLEVHAPRMYAKLRELASSENVMDENVMGVPQQITTQTWFYESGAVKRSKVTKHFE
eukprot:5812302-Amphidinium_carterae.1